jgi:Flp pilus assembly pilin Flp
MRWRRSTEGRLGRFCHEPARTLAWLRAWTAGQGIVEYGLILSLSALLAVVLLVVFGPTLSAFLQVVGDAIDAAT